jgi:hypothetical protein
MIKAIRNGKVIAESDHTEIVEGNHYFPADALRKEFFRPSETHTVCPWKGVASYYTVEVDGQKNPMRPGTIRSRNQRHARSQAEWRSGRVAGLVCYSMSRPG